MHQSVALRASAIFALLTVVFGAIGIGSYSPVAEALTVLTGTLSLMTALFGLTAAPAPIAVRARRGGRHLRR